VFGQATPSQIASFQEEGTMGGLYGVASRTDCVSDLFYGTDYHSHLGTVRGGLAVRNERGFTRLIKDITTSQFRSKFEDDLGQLHGPLGIGVISDYEDQPLINESGDTILVSTKWGRIASFPVWLG
jgi:amidophosphoribosyltransferase